MLIGFRTFSILVLVVCFIAIAQPQTAEALPIGMGQTYVRQISGFGGAHPTADALIMHFNAVDLVGYEPALNAELEIKLFAGSTQLGSTISSSGIEIHDYINFLHPSSFYADAPNTILLSSDFDSIRNGTYTNGDWRVEITMLNASGNVNVDGFILGAGVNSNSIEVLAQGGLGAEYAVPEPSSLTLICASLLGFDLLRRRKNR